MPPTNVYQFKSITPVPTHKVRVFARRAPPARQPPREPPSQ